MGLAMKRLLAVSASVFVVSGCSAYVVVSRPETPIIQMPTFLLVDVILLLIVMIIMLAVIAGRLKS